MPPPISGGSCPAPVDQMMFGNHLATADDVRRLLGNLDPETVVLILSTLPTRLELEKAVGGGGTRAAGEPKTPSCARVASIRRVLASLPPR
ncbi:MAG: hypothetical protein JWP01_104 [Myxococcales bacterium]|nr:hypothetical protein [Myxococcales bacterium]